MNHNIRVPSATNITCPLGGQGNINPLNGNAYSERYEELKQTWSKLPAYAKFDEIEESIKKYQLNFIISGTGSGKTVITPKIALHYLDYKGRIAITLPKRRATKVAATYSAETLDAQLGKEVGYVYKGSDKSMINDSNKLVYMTDGTLVSKIISDPYFTEYNIIIVDEAHERKINIDLILLFLKNILLSGKRPDLKVIIMSATIDADKYQKYFSPIKSNIINISGLTNYPIEIKYLDFEIKSNQYLQEGLIVAENLILENKSEDILFFLTSPGEAIKACGIITPKFLQVYCIEVYADMPEDIQKFAESKDQFKNLGNYTMKLIMATNVAESSITIEGLSYIIDSCYELYAYFDPLTTANVLEKRLITKAQCAQRSGRVGRTRPGICYRLLTKNEFDQLRDYPDPDILKQDISIDILKIMTITEKKNFQQAMILVNGLMDIPRQEFITYSFELLTLYKLIDDDRKITDIGGIILMFPSVPIHRTLFMYYAFQTYCGREACIIVAMLEALNDRIANLFREPDKNNIGKIKSLMKKKSDHLTLLNIYQNRKKYDFLRQDVFNRAQTISNTYYFKLVNLKKSKAEISRVTNINVNKCLLESLKRSHQHLTGKKFQSIYAKKKLEADFNSNSVVVHNYTRKQLYNKMFIYDNLTCIENRCEFNIIQIV